jgi:hypothetical protein
VTTGSSTGGVTGGQTTQPGYETCDLSPNYYASAIGYIGVCQNTITETLVTVKPTQTVDGVRVCLIPSYKEGSGSSTYIGQPQCYYQVANQIVSGQLYKNRPGFTSYPLNALMIMRETSLTAYFNCMHALLNYQYPASCPYGAQTNASCNAMAQNYMNQVCNDFKVQHSYLDISI